MKTLAWIDQNQNAPPSVSKKQCHDNIKVSRDLKFIDAFNVMSLFAALTPTKRENAAWMQPAARVMHCLLVLSHRESARGAGAAVLCMQMCCVLGERSCSPSLSLHHSLFLYLCLRQTWLLRHMEGRGRWTAFFLLPFLSSFLLLFFTPPPFHIHSDSADDL